MKKILVFAWCIHCLWAINPYDKQKELLKNLEYSIKKGGNNSSVMQGPLYIGVVNDDSFFMKYDRYYRNIGLSALIEKSLESYLNVDVKIITYESWVEGNEGVKKGEVKLIINAKEDDEGKKYLNFTKAYMPISRGVYSLEGQNVEEYHELTGERVYIKKGYYNREELIEKSKIYRFEVVEVEFLDYTLLEKGGYIYATELAFAEGLGGKRRGVQFNRLSKGIGLAVGLSKDIKEEKLRELQKFLDEYLIDILIEYAEYLVDYTKLNLYFDSLNEEEVVFMKKLKEVKYSFEENNFPYIFHLDGSKGVFIDILSEFTNALDLKLVEVDERNEDLADVKLVRGVKEKGYIYSRELAREKILLVGRRESEIVSTDARDYLSKRVGYVKGDVLNSEVVESYLNFNTAIEYLSDYSLMNALWEKKIDYILLWEGSYNYQLKVNGNYNMKVLGGLDSEGIYLSYSEDNYLLKSLIDKSLRYFIDESLYVAGWTQYSRDYKGELDTLKARLRKKRILIFIMGLTIIVSLFKLLMIICKNRKNQLVIAENRVKYFDLLNKNRLTKLGNRNMLYEDFYEGKLEKIEGILVYAKLNNYSNIINLFGDEIHNEVIKNIALVLRNLREVKRLYHYDNNSFVFIIPLISIEQAEEYCKKIVRNIEKINKYPANISFGLQVVQGIEDIESLVKKTRIGSNLAQALAGDGIVVVNDNEIEKYRKVIHIEEDLIRGIKEMEFTAFYQPKVDCRTGRVVGAEALIRWHHRSGELIYPGSFLECAERRGLIVELDFLILEKGLAYLRTLIDKGLIGGGFRIAFNFSIKTFLNAEMFLRIVMLLNKYSVKGDNVEIEVTEASLLKDFVSMRKAVEKIKSLGIRISLDDFSAGHSSPKYINQFDIDIVKIDRSLVENLGKSEREYRLLKLLVNMIKELELGVVVEGVEEENQLELIKSLGIDIVQGYFYSKPLEERAFEDYLIANNS